MQKSALRAYVLRIAVSVDLVSLLLEFVAIIFQWKSLGKTEPGLTFFILIKY